MRPSSAVRELWVGILLAVAFIVFFVLLISVGEQHNLLAPKNEYHARFTRTQGLGVGAPVWLEGVPVGSVTSIHFPEEVDDFDIIVTFQIERSLAPRIRQDTTAVILSQGLIGEALMGLERGSHTAPIAEAGAFLPTREVGTLEEFKTQGQLIAENIVSISSDIRALLAKLEEGEGLAARLLVDEEFAEKIVDRLDRSTVALTELAEGLNRGESFLGRVLAAEDPEGALAAESLFDAIERVEEIVSRVERGEGTLGRLLTSDEEFDNLVTSMSEMSRAVRKFIRQVEEGEGLLAQLLLDEEAGREVVEDLRSASEHIANIARELDEGQGTLGALLEDPSLYEAMEDLVEGIEKSRVLRWFVRRKISAGAEEDLAHPAPAHAPDEPGPREGVSRSPKKGDEGR